jgi:transposase
MEKARVSLDYHVEFDHHYYSVPCRLVHQEVFLRATESTLEVFHKHRRVASYPRSRIRGQFTTLPEHMPAAHRAYGEWSPERFLRWA